MPQYSYRIEGKTLVLSIPPTEEVLEDMKRDGVETKPDRLIIESKLRIQLTKDNENYKYIVALIGRYVPFQDTAIHVFNKDIEGASWLKWKRLGKKLHLNGIHPTVFVFLFLLSTILHAAQKLKFCIQKFFSKCGKICSELKRSFTKETLNENFIF